MLIEMLSGQPVFPHDADYQELLRAKRQLSGSLQWLLPEPIACNQLLMSFLRHLVAADPMRRFPDAEAADLVKEGAASFHRQLIKGDLASEYGNEIRLWVDELLVARRERDKDG